uniref:S-adenosylmethionine:tRNA ribosyltransferase-isomerase n=1 Tax=Desulfobacca acetoxidans TaxID=60893 RepID=A0A7C3Z1Y0_9BACT
MTLTLADFDYHLPPELIAQHPAPRRSDSRLMVLDRASQTWTHRTFAELPDILDDHDFLVMNDTRVFPARLSGRKASGGRVEILLHHLPEPVDELPVPRQARARASYRGHRLKIGQVLDFGENLCGEITALSGGGVAEVLFHSRNGNVLEAILNLGKLPLPPYIRRAPEERDQERYQTVYAARPGAIAAPTAGLHFTPEVLTALERGGIEWASLTLHVGPGTFQPVRHQDYTRHQMHPEYFIMPAGTAARLNQARAAGKHLVAVGTTSVRVLEHCAGPEGFSPQEGWCGLYIYPGYRFQAVDHLLTNFHLPRSTLLLLAAAFAGRDLILAAYADAIRNRYRFYSYGDCMLIG